MKNNLILYILLVFLVIVNGFFLYNYLSPTILKSNDNSKGDRSPSSFIVKALGFDEQQMKQFEEVDVRHHKNMIKSAETLKVVKDQLAKQIIKENVLDAEVDSILDILVEKEKAHEKLMFNHLRAIRNICTNEQKQRFEQIIQDALRGGSNGKRLGDSGPPPPDGMNENGPPPDNMPEGDRPPEGMREGGPPPRPE